MAKVKKSELKAHEQSECPKKETKKLKAALSEAEARIAELEMLLLASSSAREQYLENELSASRSYNIRLQKVIVFERQVSNNLSNELKLTKIKMSKFYPYKPNPMSYLNPDSYFAGLGPNGVHEGSPKNSSKNHSESA